ncbi:hypothetical protein [Aurantivibrio infirmus]
MKTINRQRLISFSKIVLSLFTTALVLLSFNTMADAPRVSNFLLIDQEGLSHELHYYSDSEAIVIMGHNAKAKNMQSLVSQYKNIATEFENKGIKFYLLNASGDSRQSIQDLGLGLATLLDESQLVSNTIGLNHVGEVIVIAPQQKWQRVYLGPISTDTNELLKSALNSHLNGSKINSPTVAMPKASIALHDIKTHTQNISYSETVAPILLDKCATCHRPEGIGPWAMTSYEMIKGFAPMIKEVILTKRMPPWHADPHVNSFQEDLSLSIEEQQTIITWVDAGAERGKGNDPLKSVVAKQTEWDLGEPDLIVELPEFDIPATGVLDYQNFEVANPLDKDVWVRAVQIIPGDRKILHHAIASFGDPVNPGNIKNESNDAVNETNSSILQQQLMTFVPGNEKYVYPSNTALKVPAGSSFFTQMHYTPSGKATKDKTRIGLYFRDDAPKHILRHYAIIDPAINIPVMDGSHEEAAYYKFERDAVIFALFPHSHYRGKSSKFFALYPDGKKELLLSVPNYDFNWQRYFKLEKPLEVPAGTLVIHSTVYDNSPLKLSNPDPKINVRWGLQSWEEMLYGGVSYRYAEEPEDGGALDPFQNRVNLAMGYMDTDFDGKITIDELPEASRERMMKLIPWFDANKSGGIEVDELANLLKPRNPTNTEKTE